MLSWPDLYFQPINLWSVPMAIPTPSKETVEQQDNVNHPKHYEFLKDVEAIDVIKLTLTRGEYLGYLKGNALKYRLRAGDKGGEDKALEDLKKSNWYRNEYNRVV